MNIDPATLPQIQKGRRGTVVFIDHDSLDVAKRLREIHGSLRLAWNEFGQYFVVLQQFDDGTEHLVTTAQTADNRLVEKIRKIVHPSYNLADELDKLDAARNKKLDDQFSQKVKEKAEYIAHAIRKDLSAPRTDINRYNGKKR